MAGIYTSLYPSPYTIEKVGDFPHSYSVNVKISRQNENEFE